MDKWVEVGKEMGLSGTELMSFVREREKRAREARMEQLELKRLEEKTLTLRLEVVKAETLEPNTNDESTNNSSGLKDTGARAPKLPFYDENRDDLDAYLQRYERYATSHGWKADNWAINLSALLRGKALEVYARLALDKSTDYTSLKTALLKRFRLTEEGFRTKFRTAIPDSGETASQFSVRLANYFSRWVDLSTTEKTYDGLQDLLLREQFINGSSRELALFLKERKPQNIESMTTLAEQYIEAHGGKFEASHVRRPPNSTAKVDIHHPAKERGKKGTPVKQQAARASDWSARTCFICHKPGHFASDCRQRGCSQQTVKVAGLVSSEESSWRRRQSKGSRGRDHCRAPERPTTVQKQHTVAEGSSCCSCECCGTTKEKPTVACMVVDEPKFLDCCANNGFVNLTCGHTLPIISAACNVKIKSGMPVTDGEVGTVKVRVLRDSGCSGVVVRQGLVSLQQMTGQHKMCVLIDGSVRKLPTALIYVNTPFFIGATEALCMKTPVYDLILGNIPSARAATNPDPEWKSSCTNEQDSIELKEAVLAVQTRAQAKAEEVPPRRLKIPSAIPDITPEDIQKAQEADPTLDKIRELANNGVKEDFAVRNSNFVRRNKMLFRVFQSVKVDFGNVVHQLVVPTLYRQMVMKLAHEGIVGGHLGVKKTTDKIKSSFFWPGMQADITRYCRSCDICQRTIPKGRVTRLPLGRMLS